MSFVILSELFRDRRRIGQNYYQGGGEKFFNINRGREKDFSSHYPTIPVTMQMFQVDSFQQR